MHFLANLGYFGFLIAGKGIFSSKFSGTLPRLLKGYFSCFYLLKKLRCVKFQVKGERVEYMSMFPISSR